MSTEPDIKGGTPSDWIVCGWFTEDDKYRPLAEQLAASLDNVGAPYDLVATPALSGGWEANTMVGLGIHPGATGSYASDVTADGSVIVGPAYTGGKIASSRS